ncbi:hypothetical protein RhiJN_25689 [Ceratobasidium sp. AG-Ba]|nr:hypothetical protein RhiJN_25689 [Ceratobasidium sp. AG-Ba]
MFGPAKQTPGEYKAPIRDLLCLELNTHTPSLHKPFSHIMNNFHLQANEAGVVQALHELFVALAHSINHNGEADPALPIGQDMVDPLDEVRELTANLEQQMRIHTLQSDARVHNIVASRSRGESQLRPVPLSDGRIPERFPRTVLELRTMEAEPFNTAGTVIDLLEDYDQEPEDTAEERISQLARHIGVML